MTGATSGIGRAAARMFAARGDQVVLVGRRAEQLEALRAELVHGDRRALAMPADLADTAQAEEIIARTVESCGRIDILVNNAAFGLQSRFEEMTLETAARMFAVNVLSCMALARAAIPVMRRQGSGSIVNVASVGGLVAHPLNVAYCATKHALIGFSKSLRLELKGSGIRVVVVCPGATRTEFFERASADIPFAPMIERFARPPEVVARAIVKASRSRRALVFPTLDAWFLYFVDRWLPWLSEAGNLRYRDTVIRMAGAACGSQPVDASKTE
ncbi:MAG: SDR family NAD(P)-dependent oxidoreductase [Deltaproteobacteria bacterium]|nr:SDR family NAD(P)-dependent oxidoreductase [Deltaproteobacteria bacterium]